MFVLGNVTFDCADPQRLADFWSKAAGYQVIELESNDFMVTVAPPNGARPNLLFMKVPEPKSGKNRVHVDFGVSDIEAEVTRLEQLGATRGGSFEEWGFKWTVMADPEGNEFCIGHPHS